MSARSVSQMFARGVRVGTSLQDAMGKVRRCWRKSETEFELALGEMFVLSSDAFVQRNELQKQLQSAKQKIAELTEELEHLKQGSSDG